MQRLDQGAIGIVLLVDEDRHLIATVTDGDIRRALLGGMSLDTTLATWLEARGERPAPITRPVGTTAEDLRQLMLETTIRHVPLVNAEGQVEAVVLESDLLGVDNRQFQALVMAGGLGKRLWPLTKDTPKPLLDVGEKPVIERIVDQIKDAGISRVAVSTHYKAEMIEEHLGDGSKFGVGISYVREEQPLGTAGALGLMEPWEGTLMMVNGDILTKVRYELLLDYHRENKAAATIGVRRHTVDVAFGVMDLDGHRVTGIREKPTLEFFVNAGVYLLEASVLTHVNRGERMDMPELMQKLLDAGEPVTAFPILEDWIDIGRPSDYEKANENYAGNK